MDEYLDFLIEDVSKSLIVKSFPKVEVVQSDRSIILMGRLLFLNNGGFRGELL